MTDVAQHTGNTKVFGRGESAAPQSVESHSTRIATLETPTTCIEVRELSWAEPTAVCYKSDRPVFTLLVSGPPNFIEAGYAGESVQKPSKNGGVVLTPPDRDMLSRSRMPGKLHIVSCAFDRNYAERVVDSFASRSRAQLCDFLELPSSLLPSILLRLKSEAVRPGFVSAAMAESLGHAMLVEFCHVTLADSSRHEQRGRLSARHFRTIEEYVAGLSCEAPSIAAIAALCGMSERYLSKAFREQTNQTLGQYLRSVQIAKARAYLTDTDLPLKEIAYRLGFSTPANFSIAFRTATGETPGRFGAVSAVRSGKRTS